MAAGSGSAPASGSESPPARREGLLPRRESLWLGEGWTIRFSPLPSVPSRPGRGDSYGHLQNVRRKFSDLMCKNLFFTHKPDRQTKQLPWIALKSYCFGDFLHPFDRILNQFIQSNSQHLGPFFDD